MKLCIITVFLLFSYPFFLYAAHMPPQCSAETEQENDSLLSALSHTTDPNKKIDILSSLAFLQQKHDLDLCLKYTEEMLSLVEENFVKIPRAEIYYTNMAIIFLSCDIYDKALELFLKSLSIAEKKQNQQYIRTNKNNIGGVYFRLEQYEQALNYFKDALSTTETMIAEGDTMQKGLLHAFYNNIGLCYISLNNISEASRYIQKAISLCDTNDYENLGQYYNNMAGLHYELGNKTTAYDNAWKSIAYRKKTDNENGLARSNLVLASLLQKDGKIAEAKHYAQQALKSGEKINSKLLLQNAYTLLVEIYETEKNYQKANSFLKKLYDIRSQLLNDTISSKITAMKLQYEFDKQVAQNTIQNRTKELKYQLYLVIILSLLGGITLLYFLAHSKNKRIRLEKINLEKDLEIQNKELTTNVMFLIKNTDLIHSITNRLLQVKTTLKGENAVVVKDIIAELQSVMKNDLWDEFKVRFNRVHLDFYKKLQDYCPDLSPTDLKLCAFLRLNMSSKEISALCGITVRSVEVMRSRLRKKLKITNTDVNLNTFLSEF